MSLNLQNDGKFKKGNTPWNKGKRGVQKAWNKGLKTGSNPDHSQKMKGRSPWNKGKTNIYSKETIEKMSKGHIGEKNINWKGGISPKSQILRAQFIQTIGKQVLKRDRYSCVLCGSKKQLQVDHIQSWAEYVELRFSIDNCRTLCRSCHYFVTFSRPMPINSKWGTFKSKEVISYDIKS